MPPTRKSSMVSNMVSKIRNVHYIIALSGVSIIFVHTHNSYIHMVAPRSLPSSSYSPPSSFILALFLEV